MHKQKAEKSSEFTWNSMNSSQLFRKTRFYRSDTKLNFIQSLFQINFQSLNIQYFLMKKYDAKDIKNLDVALVLTQVLDSVVDLTMAVEMVHEMEGNHECAALFFHIHYCRYWHNSHVHFLQNQAYNPKLSQCQKYKYGIHSIDIYNKNHTEKLQRSTLHLDQMVYL